MPSEMLRYAELEALCGICLGAASCKSVSSNGETCMCRELGNILHWYTMIQDKNELLVPKRRLCRTVVLHCGPMYEATGLFIDLQRV